MVKSSNIGYPRIGENREWKKALEQYWAGKLEQKNFLKEMETIRLTHLKKQQEKGIDFIPVGDFSFYDHMLDTAAMFGLIPKRFDYKGGEVSLDQYFSIARGSKNAVASEMTKWFNTNYHYIVPEFDGSTPTLVDNRPLRFYQEAKEKLGIQGKPVVIGPITFVKLAKGYEENKWQEVVQQLVPLYAQILQELFLAGAEWVQIEEPILATTIGAEELALCQVVYQTLKKAAPSLKINLQTYFESIDQYQQVVSLPVDGIGLDFVYDEGENLASLKKYGFPQEKVLFAGVVDGRNIWRNDLQETFGLLDEILNAVAKENLVIQASCSLLHVPVTAANEKQLEPVVGEAIAFADEKLTELTLLAKGAAEGKEAVASEIQESTKALTALQKSSYRNNQDVQYNINHLETFAAERQAAFPERIAIQERVFQLPILPTTTIGSFPQTQEVRKQRLKWRKGELSQEAYEQYIEQEIQKWISIQEELELDVLVHGEFERTDMVEYFGEKLAGFQFTKFAWVQSYGSRCVKPPIIFGDVAFQEPMTVKETVYAKQLTSKPVKGMLTGPITILNWSFVRNDIKRSEVANQIALALRKEVEELVNNGINMIQVDEPALREGLPLKEQKREIYLQNAVYAFKLATAFVENDTQIHTHMCYADFEDIIDSIEALDVDVISIEMSRSHGELLTSFEENSYDKGIGLGVYDIHSPRIPALEEITRNIDRALQVLEAKLFWINPDCGLKTRGEYETIEALKVMVEAAKETRKKLLATKA
ncbi:5-methyltetrahydropteroyltriglutamate--homocysteine S-methyltransferase [Niallia sp. NCCP-28]|uniref:5-methyltetrahydropteroyltriglutamate-- homocysteine S-methyltransferase n=1 Tax=Niallia sp. NCCP-28 TaxID=2934712 RepID=UPI0020864BEA|nr:5-methyltetrahydropteroyltriglutamate--homocysteine S-methyltransferase [Niallia sp. NCCP-28]GKU82629.1 5-methyltetrahydropteroyltriglutamate--homocysteine methyltransferase [Niallia sp. NCCP-28]